MNVKLIRHTPDPDGLCGEAAAICTHSGNPARALRGAMRSGHLSVMEHASFTFRIEGVSRVMLAQMTRHRIASFSVESQRYCGMQMEYIAPHTIEQNKKAMEAYAHAIHTAGEAYDAMIACGIPMEDARYVMPQAFCTDLIVSMNARELFHFFSLRCCNRAQREIQSLAWQMLEECRVVAPELFRDAGPGCLRGACPEGKMSCGKPYKKGADEHDA